MTFLIPSVPFSNPEINAAAEWVAACAIEQVEDPETRRKLTPDTPWGCLRPLFSNHYYPTFNRPNVELTTEAITRIGMASFGGMFICRAALIWPAALSMSMVAIRCSHLRL